MSYSRWIGSEFYTYWYASSAKIRDEEIFMCHVDLDTIKEWTYLECKAFLKTPEKLTETMNSNLNSADNLELRSYFTKFIKDVDKHYTDKGEQNNGQPNSMEGNNSTVLT